MEKKQGWKTKKAKRSAHAIDLDSQIKAKKPGRRVSESGNVYYESRPNHSDENRKKKPFLKEGGKMATGGGVGSDELKPGDMVVREGATGMRFRAIVTGKGKYQDIKLKNLRGNEEESNKRYWRKEDFKIYIFSGESKFMDKYMPDKLYSKEYIRSIQRGKNTVDYKVALNKKEAEILKSSISGLKDNERLYHGYKVIDPKNNSNSKMATGGGVGDVVSNIHMSWSSTKKITDDIRNFIFDSYEAAGQELAADVIEAIEKGIEFAKIDIGI